MKILVTGAAGFIGSHLSTALLNRGDTVIGIDNFNDYYNVGRKRANIAEIRATFPYFQCLELDIREREAILALFEDECFDAVVHLAAMAGVRNSVQDPALYVGVNYNGTQNLMDGARFNRVDNFVCASTSSIYGNTTQIPFLESDPCAFPIQPYAAAKRAVEMLGYTYQYLFDLNFTATRFFTVYGPKGRPDMMAYLLADSIQYGREIPYYNDGEMWRDWTYVDDIVDGLVRALDRPLGFEILNLGRGEPILLKEFVHLMEETAGGHANLKPMPKMEADMVRTYADISKAAKMIGYQPKVKLADGVKGFWEWYIAQQYVKTE